MKPGNRRTGTGFIMLGLTSDPNLQILLFILLLPVYIFTLLGNVSILVIVGCNTHLQTPAYFFPSQLRCLDHKTVICPKMLVVLLSNRKTISFYGCVTQVFFFAAIGSSELFLLAVMAFDHYVAVCKPLLYTVTMTNCLCMQLVAWTYIGHFLQPLIHECCICRLTFCGPDVMNYYVCDYPVLVKLSCTDISINDLVCFVFASLVVLSSRIIILITYAFIIIAILNICTTAKRWRAASTCVSHSNYVIIFCGNILFMAQIFTMIFKKQS
ncbi:olfactory receptor-like protein COR4 [Lissotriton helveticus]